MKDHIYLPKEGRRYPVGADYDIDAPYNIQDPPKKEFTLAVSCSLSRDVRVVSDCYSADSTLDNPYAEYEYNFKSIEEIMYFAKECAAYFLTLHDYKLWPEAVLKEIISSCKDWTVDEFNIEQVSL